MFCRNCGNQIEDSSSFCVHCGCAVRDANQGYSPAFSAMPNQQQFYQNQNPYSYQATVKKLSEYEKTSGIIWLIIGIIQCISLVGIICGIWNIVVSIQRLNYSKSIPTARPEEIYKNFENQLTSIIIFLVLNIFLGAFIGIIGAIFDLFVRNYVMDNKNVFIGNQFQNINGQNFNYQNRNQIYYN